MPYKRTRYDASGDTLHRVDRPDPAFKEAVYWRRRACGLSRLVLAGWWWQAFSRWLLVVSMALAVAALIARVRGGAIDWLPVVAGLSFVAFAVGAYARARHRRVDLTAALSRLDVALGLHHRLVSAEAGVGDWPPIPAAAADPRTRSPLFWRWSRTATPVALSSLALALAVWLPVAGPDGARAAAHHEPPGWAEVERMVAELSGHEAVEERALEEVRQRVEELRRQPRETWYRQGSLEATDHLQQQVERNIQRLQQTLEKTAALLETAGARREQMTQAQLEALSQELKALLDQLEAGALPLNDAMLQELRKADPSNLRAMSSTELAGLKQRLRDQADAVGSCMTRGGMASKEPGSDAINRRSSTLPNALARQHLDGGAQGRNRGSGTTPVSQDGYPAIAGANAPMPLAGDDRTRTGQGETPGRGGVNRGPGTLPLSLDEDPTTAKANAPLPLTNNDLTRAAPGDNLGLADGVHEVDRTAAGHYEGGAVASPGGAGEATWNQIILPAEQRVLKAYFTERTTPP